MQQRWNERIGDALGRRGGRGVQRVIARHDVRSSSADEQREIAAARSRARGLIRDFRRITPQGRVELNALWSTVSSIQDQLVWFQLWHVAETDAITASIEADIASGLAKAKVDPRSGEGRYLRLGALAAAAGAAAGPFGLKVTRDCWRHLGHS